MRDDDNPRHLDLTFCADITDDGLVFLASRVDTLEVRCSTRPLCHVVCALPSKSVPDGDMFCCLLWLCAWQTVILNGCVNVTAHGVRTLVESNRRIQELRLSHIRTVDDDVLQCCAQHLWLEKLDLSHCTSVTDAGILALAETCLGLEELLVEWCRRITWSSVKQLIRRCKQLSLLDVRNCDLVTPDKLLGIMEGREKLRVKFTEEISAEVLDKVADGETLDKPTHVHDPAGDGREWMTTTKKLQLQR